nr:hypothetical protein HIGPJJAF_00081 [Gallid alphaherpesvirus 2]WOL21673.1 hypothetical protein BMMJLCPH_00098 [Gallid alphaherpesvirus 2]WOL21903.1 hypothetical protein JGFBKGGF_00100 [Gallid alphaherpesvirus 2]
MAGTLKLVWRDFENGAEKAPNNGAHFLAPTPRFL